MHWRAINEDPEESIQIMVSSNDPKLGSKNKKITDTGQIRIQDFAVPGVFVIYSLDVPETLRNSNS